MVKNVSLVICGVYLGGRHEFTDPVGDLPQVTPSTSLGQPHHGPGSARGPERASCGKPVSSHNKVGTSIKSMIDKITGATFHHLK